MITSRVSSSQGKPQSMIMYLIDSWAITQRSGFQFFVMRSIVSVKIIFFVFASCIDPLHQADTSTIRIYGKKTIKNLKFISVALTNKS